MLSDYSNFFAKPAISQYSQKQPQNAQIFINKKGIQINVYLFFGDHPVTTVSYHHVFLFLHSRVQERSFFVSSLSFFYFLFCVLSIFLLVLPPIVIASRLMLLQFLRAFSTPWNAWQRWRRRHSHIPKQMSEERERG